jgi:glycosyltransferase involved in cell wall biosynthesis
MVVYALYPVTETRVQREAEALARSGTRVDVICLRGEGEPARERYRGVEIHRVPVRRVRADLGHQLMSYAHFLLLAAVRLTRLHLQHPYRTVQVHNLPDFLVFCALVPKLLGARIILDLHDLMPEFFAGRFGASPRGLLPTLIRWQERLACGFADHVITVSEHWRRTLIQRGVPERKCSVVMNVADERIFTRAPDTPRPAGESFRLIYHGAISYRHGLDLAIRAVGLLRDEIPEIHLTIIGRGDELPALMELRRELDLEERVELGVDFVPIEDLPAILSSADLGLAPYRNDVFTDGIVPTKLMEYAVLGVPSVAARTTAIESYFSGAGVMLFEPGDVADLVRCLRELHRDPERRAALARETNNFTREHSWDTVGASYVDLVRGLARR